MEKRVLLLNANYSPMKIISWQKAILMYFSDKVDIVESYDDFTLGSVKFSMPCPSVVVLRKYAKISDKRITFSRGNVFSRDHYTCQYCGSQPGVSSLTFDHVIPRSKGGKTEWENIVTSCIMCNSKKADKSLNEANMKLKKKPEKPRSYQELIKKFNYGKIHRTWEAYVSM